MLQKLCRRSSTWIAISLIGACAKPMSTERTVVPQKTLGTDVYVASCKRVAYAQNPQDVAGDWARSMCMEGAGSAQQGTRLWAIQQQREALIGAVDELIPASLTHGMRVLLENTLDLYDNGLIPSQTRTLAGMCSSVMASQEAVQKLGKLLAQKGYMPASHSGGLVGRVLTYPALEEAVFSVLPLLLKDGAAYAPWMQTTRTLQHMLSNAQDTFGIQDVASYSALKDVLLSERDVFGDGASVYVAKRDMRGYAMPQRINGLWRAPFVDANGDAMADVNAEGMFVDASGRVFDAPTPFQTFLQEQNVTRDAWGRARYVSDGALVYSSVDASKTLLSAMLQEVYPVLEKRPSLWADMIQPAPRWLGPVVQKQHRYANGEVQSFTGYDTRGSAVLELNALMGFLSSKPSSRWSVKLVYELLQKDEATLARLADALRSVYGWSREEPFKSAVLKENNLFADDMLAWLEEVVSVPGLLENILKAFEDPASRPLGGLFAKHMRYKDRIDVDTQNINARPLGGFTQPVQRGAADGALNRSIMQRFLHLVHDTNKARFCNKQGAQLVLGSMTYPFSGEGYEECALFQIDNMAVFYMQSVLGKAEIDFKDPFVGVVSNLDFMLEATSGIEGFSKNPTPQAVNRMIFAPRNAFLQNLMDAPLSKDGVPLEQRHPATIFAWELNGFYDAIKPLMKAFADVNREDLLADLMSVLHTHYATENNDTTQSLNPGLPAYSAHTGLVQFEELLARVLGDADMLAIQGDLLRAVRRVNMLGVSGTSVVVDAVRQMMLPSWNEGLRLRDGGTVAMKGDGVTQVEALSPAQVLRVSLKSLDASFEGYAADKEMFMQSVDVLVHHFLQVQAMPEGARFVRRKALAVAQEWLVFAEQKMAQHAQARDIEVWGKRWAQDVEDAVNHPMTAGMVLMMDAFLNNPQVRQHIQDAMLYLLKPSVEDAGWHGLVSVLVDAVQAKPAMQDAAWVFEKTAPYVGGEEGLLHSGVRVLKAMHDKDTQHVLAKVLSEAGKRSAYGVGGTPLDVLWDALLAVNRAAPGALTPMGTQDTRVLLQHLHEVLTDKNRGLERLYEVVAHRK
jgi:hypothetical protein